MCDAAAAHAKKAITYYTLNQDIPCYTPADLATAINTTNHHQAVTLATTSPLPVGLCRVKTYDGIKSYYKFLFEGEGVVLAYANSFDTVPLSKFHTSGQFIDFETAPTNQSVQ